MRVPSSGRLAALFLSLLAATVFPALAAAATQPEIDAALAKSEAYLKTKVTSTGEPSDPAGGIAFEHSPFSAAWSTVALAAVGVNAADATAGGPSLQDFLSAEYGSPTSELAGPPSQFTTEEWSRLALIAHAAGLDTSRVSATLNLPARIAGKWNGATGSLGSVESTAFPVPSALGLLGLLTSPTPRWALAPSIAKLRALQESDGGWTEPGGFPRAETTGIVLAALCSAGVPAYDPAVQAGISYLHSQKQPGTGAIEATYAEVTAFAVIGLNACGVDLNSLEWTRTGATPVDFLLGLQKASGAGEGGFEFEPGEEPNLYTTTFATLAIAGDGLLVEPPAREDAALPTLRPAPSVADGTTVAHVLAIEGPAGGVRICSVEGPSGASLRELLGDAEAETFPTYPAGCVRSFTYEGARLVSLNGQGPENADQSWVLRLDRGNEAVAGEQPVPFGDVISLRVGATPASAASGAGSQGPAGETGSPGPQGSPGASGETGATGAPGATGPAGVTGATGPKGVTGPTGPAGKRGTRGPAGKSAKRAKTQAKSKASRAKVREPACAAPRRHAKKRERRCVVRRSRREGAKA
jgi:hypothetical protein